MTTHPPQPPPAPQAPPAVPHWWNDKELFLRGLIQSNYVTSMWDWCMMLLGKAAEPVLFASVLYSGYELLPGVPQPGAVIDAPMFVTQQAALDIGGLGLMKLAKHTKLPKDSLPYRVGIILVGLMIVNVATASLEKVVHLPTLATTIMEATLLIARAVMAVLYGHAIHALKDEGVTLAQGQPRMQEQIEQVQAQVEDLAQETEQHVQQLAKKLATVQESATVLASRLRAQYSQELAPLQAQMQALADQMQEQVSHLQTIDLQTVHLQNENQTLSAHLQTTHLHIADLAAKWEEVTRTIANLQTAKQAPATARSAKQTVQRNITLLDEARARHETAGQGRAKVSHADVLAFMATHPDLKRAEVAEQLGISERKVYDAIAWGKDQEHASASAQ